MKKTIVDALKAYDERYYREKLDASILNAFGKELESYALKINQAVQQKENEEYFKNIVNDFIKRNFYQNERYTINTDKYIDSTIKYDGQLLALIETKKPDNKSEMLTVDSINRKGLWELIYYYLVATRDVTGFKVRMNPHIEIRRLIVTNSVDWFIFDANDIEKYCTGHLEKTYFKYCNNQLNYAKDISKFYQEIRNHLEKSDITEKLDFIHFNLNDTYKKKSEWRNLYKIFSNFYLLKNIYKPTEKAHVLNNKFYQELLYILGLKELKQAGKNVIIIDTETKNSMAEQVYRKYIEDKEEPPEIAFENTFELVIIWINRLLFIKLFEGQLVSFNTNNSCYHILDNDKIASFQNLQDLFFNVLGKRERTETEFYNKFSEIPYLNSSLFEKQEIEKKDININDLKNVPLTLKSHSILTNKKIKELPLLQYIIDFLNSYDFGAYASEEGVLEHGKDIIDASVLGLIFEKINGYKDGSFYTPSEITEYMNKETLERIVIQKINQEMRWHCKTMDDLKFEIDSTRTLELYQKLNEIINSIRICDPAVGSGHFLVSALNRLIAIKADLGIIFIHGTTRLLRDYDIYVQDDTLIIEDAQGQDFIYDKSSVASQQIQETLFIEKKTIIEECLFGVDLNAKAVHICQLRLWIELLKNAYYKNGIMETLPNIDIDIKVGNSLINKIPFVIGKRVGSKDTGFVLDSAAQKILREYKKNVKAYKSESNKVQKEKIKKTITSLKDNMYSQYFQLNLFEDWETYNDEYLLYKNALEWAIEFPEILSEEGVFLGFDCIIGNPPYIQLQSIHEEADKLSRMNYLTYAKTGDIYCLFYELGYKLLKNNGILSYITSNKWMKAGYGETLREFFLNYTDTFQLIDSNFPHHLV